MVRAGSCPGESYIIPSQGCPLLAARRGCHQREEGSKVCWPLLQGLHCLTFPWKSVPQVVQAGSCSQKIDRQAEQTKLHGEGRERDGEVGGAVFMRRQRLDQACCWRCASLARTQNHRIAGCALPVAALAAPRSPLWPSPQVDLPLVAEAGGPEVNVSGARQAQHASCAGIQRKHRLQVEGVGKGWKAAARTQRVTRDVEGRQAGRCLSMQQPCAARAVLLAERTLLLLLRGHHLDPNAH